MADTTREILAEVRTDIKYIKRFVEENKAGVECNKGEIETINDWKDGVEVRYKTLVGVATFIGGIVVFVGNFVWDFFSKRQ